MKRMVMGAIAAALVAGCGGSAGGSAGGSGGTGSSGSASVNVTVSGAVSGSSSRLASDKSSRCASMSGARLIHTFAMNLYPVIGGKDYHVAILIGHFDGAGTITLPSSDTNAYIADASNNGDIWESGQDSSGTITINASGGGSLDLKDLKAMLSGSTVDELKVSWTC